MIIPSATSGRRIWLLIDFCLTAFAPVRSATLISFTTEQAYFYVGTDSPPAAMLNSGQGVPDLDLPEYTLLPGLIEAHAHLFLEGGELDSQKRADYLKQTPEVLLQLAHVRLEKLVRLGITAVRDAGDRDGVGLALSKLYEAAERPLMPYVDSPGAAIYHRGRYGSFMAEPLENFTSAAACVEARLKAGAHRIKLILTGIINFKKGAVTTEPQMSTEEVGDIVAAAKSAGVQTFAHASGDEGIQRGIEGEVDSIEHGYFVRQDQLMKMRDRNIGWVPTFAPVQKTD